MTCLSGSPLVYTALCLGLCSLFYQGCGNKSHSSVPSSSPAPPGSTMGPTITTLSLPAVVIGTPYDQTLQATGGAPPYSWMLVSGSLPTGFLLDYTGKLSGTLFNRTQGQYAFRVRVTDTGLGETEKDYVISVDKVITVTTPSNLPAATAGQNYSVTLQASGGDPPYTWSGVSFPPGLSVSPEGVLSGAPASMGTFSFSVTATDSLTLGQQAVASKQLSLQVN